MAEPKVSVVIATFRSGPGLDLAIASLDAQSLAQTDFEVLLLDDGSPDDTAERIRAIAEQRPNYRAFALEASGWPSRPRNIGVREARGRYVLFMDHDDTVYPDGLRAAVELGERAGADVVNGKEVRTRMPRWGLTQYVADLTDARDQPLRGLLPMTPHKLYRREFLLAHDIRFPEAPRHLWEDLFFHVDVIRHHPKVALLSSTPFYHWRDTGDNNSTSTDGTRLDYSGDPAYWPYLDKLFQLISTVEDPAIREELLVQNAQVRLVSQIGHREAAADVAADRAEITRLLAAYVPSELDHRLSTRSRAALALFRAGHADEAAEFLRNGRDRRAECRVVDLVEDDGTVVLRGTVAWARDADQPFARPDADGSLRRGYSPRLDGLLAELGVPLTPDLADSEVSLVVRHGATRVNWLLPTTAQIDLVEQPDGSWEPAGTFEARFDPRTAAMGHPVAPGKHLVLGMTELEDRSNIQRAFCDLPDDTRVGPVVVATGVTGGLVLRVSQDAEDTARGGPREAPTRWRRLLGGQHH